MTSERECYVYVVLPGQTEFVTAGRFRVSETRDGTSIGEFVFREQEGKVGRKPRHDTVIRQRRAITRLDKFL